MTSQTVATVARPRSARWPTIVLGLVVGGLLVADAMTFATWRGGYPAPYEYWREATLGPLAYAIVGWTIAIRIPDNRLGAVMLAGAGVSSIQDLAGNLAVIGHHLGWTDEAVAWLAGTFHAAQVISVGFLVAVLLLVPNGRTLSRFFHGCLMVLALSVTVAAVAELVRGTTSDSLKGVPDGATLATDATMPVARTLDGLGSIGLVVVLFLAMVGVVLRWRRSDGEARRQVTWVVLGGLAGPVLVLSLLVIPSSWPGWTHDGSAVWAVAGLMLPLGIAVAVLRHGLYELDHVVSRTVSYTIVTGGVVVVYVAVVAVVSQLAPASDNLAVAAATLAAAAVVRPLLRRVRDRVDKQFNRASFDHALAADRFGADLRRHLDITDIEGLLLDVVGQTLQPRSSRLSMVTPR